MGQPSGLPCPLKHEQSTSWRAQIVACTGYLAHLFGKSHNESERTLCWLLGHPFKKSLLDHNNYAFQALFLRTDGPCSQHTFSLFGSKRSVHYQRASHLQECRSWTHAASPSHRYPNGPFQTTRPPVKGRTTKYLTDSPLVVHALEQQYVQQSYLALLSNSRLCAI